MDSHILCMLNRDPFTFSTQNFLVDNRINLSRVHNESDTVNGDGGLCDVGGDDAFPYSVRCHVEHPVLLLDGESAMERQNDPALRLHGVVLGLLHEGGYFIHPAQKDKEVSTLCAWVLQGGRREMFAPFL